MGRGNGDGVDDVEVVRTPGHVEHHVSFLLGGEGTTYDLTGDAVKNLRELVTRDPFALYDDDVARETIDDLAGRLDFVRPGHDAPFYVTADGGAEPCGDVELTVRLQLGGDAETHVTVGSDRSGTRAPPDAVRDVSTRQSLD